VDDTVRICMECVLGILQVNLSGGSERQVQILIDPARLAERGLSLTAVRQAIRSQNRDVSGGDLDSGKRRYLLRTVGRFDAIEELEELILDRTGDSIVRLGDVAEVRLGLAELRTLSFFNGQPVVGLTVQRETGGNVIAIRAAMLEEVKRINREILEPAGMTMALSNDDVAYVERSVSNVWTNLALGAALAAGVMFLFLRSGPLTLVGLIGIPVSTIAAFIGLLVAGRTINVISLAGVAFAIGMTLDNTIVVLEAIEQERRRGLARYAAAVAGVRRVWSAVLASTLTTVLVFVPVLFVKQEAGQIYSDIAIAISASIVLSMFVAVTLVPAACARLRFATMPAVGGAGGPVPAPGRILAALQGLLRSRTQRLVCIAATVIVSVGALIGLTPPAEYLPEGEEAKVFSSLIAPPGYSLREMRVVADQVHAKLLPHLNATADDFDAKRTDIPPLFSLNVNVEPGSLRAVATTMNPAHIEALMTAITAHFRSFPGMRAFSSRGSIISSNDGGTRSVNLDISGPELPAIYGTAQAVYRRAQEVLESPQIGSTPSSLALGQPLIELRPRWERMAELGFNLQEFGYAVAALADGAYADEFFLDDNKIDIFLYSGAVTNREVHDLIDLPIYAPTGGVLPLGAVAEMVETVATDAIRRVDGRRTVTLNIIPPRSVALETGVSLVEEQVVEYLRARGDIPPGVSIDLSGASDQLMETRAALGGNFIVSVILSYLLLVVIFTHWGYPVLILISVPLGIAGGIIGLWLLNVVGAMLPWLGLAQIRQPFDMITMLGFLILLGTVVNNPILIVDEARARLREAGVSVRDAVEAAVGSRLRPILMSTITTVCGLAPLVLIPGAGTELYRGVGAVVLFGLLFATVVTLTFLPSLLITVLEWRLGRGPDAGTERAAPAQ